MNNSPLFATEVHLEVIDLHKQQEVDTLIVQRKICGWNFSQEIIAKWGDSVDKKLKTMFWIVLHDKDATKAGHISLASKAEPHDPDLAKEDRSVMTISNFFILPQHRSGGIGRKVMDLMEDMATKEPYGSPKCKAIALDTISYKYYDHTHTYWHYLKEYLEVQPSNQLWYERRGYVEFKVIPRYPNQIDGVDIMLDAAFLRKDLA
jgi:ribosomal protein S18 acetylase RimI-like enzyme